MLYALFYIIENLLVRDNTEAMNKILFHSVFTILVVEIIINSCRKALFKVNRTKMKKCYNLESSTRKYMSCILFKRYIVISKRGKNNKEL